MRVIFLCTGNSCRSQMAEGLINHDFAGQIEAKSAGVAPCMVHPYAKRVLKEIGIDISHHKSEHMREYENQSFDLVITLCDHAARVCPVWPEAGEIVHMPFDDPINAYGTEEEIIDEYRRVRDLLRTELGEFLKNKLES